MSTPIECGFFLFRVIYQVYKLTELVTKRVLLRAEASILEVNA
jgi:hypothetical protein